ncbi:gluconokinase [Pseudoroseicyclus sp. H15]
MEAAPLRIVVMGVSGSGKTTAAADLAEALGARYIEGDVLHSEANRAKMAAGIPLTDDDRWLWLDAVAAALVAGEGPAVASCSALRRAHRDRLRDGAGKLTFLWLDGSFELVARRMAARENHFMPPELLTSQFATLEPPGPEEAIRLDISRTPEQLLADALERLGV